MSNNPPELHSYSMTIEKFDLIGYSRAGTIGLPQTNLDDTDMARLTLSGTPGPDVPAGTRIAFFVSFFPTGSNLQAPSFEFLPFPAPAIAVELEMDISQLAGVMAILTMPGIIAGTDNDPGKLPMANYSETPSHDGQVVPAGQITTTYGA
jgi:hypothetical protein